MNEKKYEKKYELQKKLISRQSEQIEALKLQIEALNAELEAKDEIINNTYSLRNELKKSIDDAEKYKEQYVELIKELRKMKEIINQEVYKGKWTLVKFLIK